MPVIKSPQYSKVINPKTGNQEPRYIFQIEYQPNEEGLSFLAESASDVTLQAVQNNVLNNITWWNSFLNLFLQLTAKLFSKPYSVENINRITKHTLNTNNTSNSFPANVTLYPKSIEISGGIFWVNWGYELESISIDIPDLAEPNVLPVSNNSNNSNKIIEGIEELNIDEIPVGSNNTEDALELDSPAKFYDKQRVKEARLKAKLAVYKAQRQMAKYVEKYGNEVSDSDTEYDSSDDESEEDEDEEVQF
jgi:hypothetical protein